MKRIMQINAGSKYGGVSAMILNFYRHMDHTQIQFDFVTPSTSSFSMVRKEIEEAGGKIIELDVRGKSIIYNLRLYHQVKTLCIDNHYEIIHIHSGYSLFNYVVAMAARQAGVQKIIVHSHNAGNVHRKDYLYARMLSGKLSNIADVRLACSKKAGSFMFNQPYLIINNGIEVEKYQFNQCIRDSIRQQYGIDNQFVIGHVGRMNKQKNHSYLLKLFAAISKIEKKSILMLVGEGELEEAIHQQAIALGIESRIIYTGLVINPEVYYSAMDCFILPSLFEGLPVVGVEAQTNGLKCYFSSTITEEVKILEDTEFFDLEENVEIIAKRIVRERRIHIQNTQKLITKKGFSIQESIQQLEKIYLE